MTTLTSQQLAHLEIIYDAYDRLYAIASHRWDSFGYYHHHTETSDLFGHYVRSLDTFRDRDPVLITWQEWVEHSRPLQEAIDAILGLIIVGDPRRADIRQISRGHEPAYRHLTPYQRCMAVFRLIEKHFPRAEYRAGGRPVRRRRSQRTIKGTIHRPSHSHAYRRSTKTTSWLPYKD